jgi:hypothetical protein
VVQGDFEGRTAGVGPVVCQVRDNTDLLDEVKWLAELT